MAHQLLGHPLGETRDPREHPVARRLDRGVQVVGVPCEVQGLGDGLLVEQVLHTDLREGFDRLFEIPGGIRLEVVQHHETTFVLHTCHQLAELKAHQPPVGAELHQVLLDLLADAGDELCSLQQAHDVPQHHLVLDLEGREARGLLVEARLVALECLEGLVAAAEDRGDGFQLVTVVAGVDGHHGHVLRNGDARHPDAARHAFRGAVPGTGLLGGDVGVGHQVHVRPGDVGRIRGQHDGAVGLGQLRESLGREGGVHEESARGDVEHLRAVTDHDECTHSCLEDAVQPLAQRPARGHLAQGTHQLGATAFGHGTSVRVGSASNGQKRLRRRRRRSARHRGWVRRLPRCRGGPRRRISARWRS